MKCMATGWQDLATRQGRKQQPQQDAAAGNQPNVLLFLDVASVSWDPPAILDSPTTDAMLLSAIFRTTHVSALPAFSAVNPAADLLAQEHGLSLSRALSTFHVSQAPSKGVQRGKGRLRTISHLGIVQGAVNCAVAPSFPPSVRARPAYGGHWAKNGTRFPAAAPPWHLGSPRQKPSLSV
ncbi:hypothetical protein LZ32DRAFT_100355 [Colletotrichum eremochloae]|nr:hypothetical protein LZ32DRAFT_100355 [Colletotrichum eremochloae]